MNFWHFGIIKAEWVAVGCANVWKFSIENTYFFMLMSAAAATALHLMSVFSLNFSILIHFVYADSLVKQECHYIIAVNMSILIEIASNFSITSEFFSAIYKQCIAKWNCPFFLTYSFLYQNCWIYEIIFFMDCGGYLPFMSLCAKSHEWFSKCWSILKFGPKPTLSCSIIIL